VTHRAIADKVARVIDDPKFFEKSKMSKGFDYVNLDWDVEPNVQSGGVYDLKFASEPDDKPMQHTGVIIAGLGLRYSTYASMVARTYMVDPTKAQEGNYKLLQSIHNEILKTIKDGVLAKDVYNKALGLLKSKKPALEKNFPKNVGYSLGLESKDTTLILSAKNTRTLKDGMTLNVTTSLSNLENPDAKGKTPKPYSLILTDTVRVGAGEGVAFTKDATADLDSVTFFFNDDEEPETKPKVQKDSRIGAVTHKNVTKTRLRAERTTNQDAEREAARREHQKELHSKKQSQGLERYGKGVGSLNGTEERKFKRFESYKQVNQIPSRVKDLSIVVDVKNLTVIVPIMGRPVPFHIHTIKNATHAPEGDVTSLRINFLSPGQGVGRKDDQPFEDPTANFVRSLTFRSRDIERIDDITKQITELKKEVARKENEKKQMEDVVEQDKLIPIKSKRSLVWTCLENESNL
jgi:nucleosome binding factor SPN SPT16 subunit